MRLLSPKDSLLLLCLKVCYCELLGVEDSLRTHGFIVEFEHA